MTSEAGYPPEGDEVRNTGQSRFPLPDVPEASTPFAAFGAARPQEAAAEPDAWNQPQRTPEPWETPQHAPEPWETPQRTPQPWDPPQHAPEPWETPQTSSDAWDAPRAAHDAWETPQTSNDAWDAPRASHDAWDTPRASGDAWEQPQDSGDDWSPSSDAYPAYSAPEEPLPQRTAMNPDEFGPQPGAPLPSAGVVPPAYPAHQLPPQVPAPPAEAPVTPAAPPASDPTTPPVSAAPAAPARAAVRVPGAMPPPAASMPPPAAAAAATPPPTGGMYGAAQSAPVQPRVYGRARPDDEPAAEAPPPPPVVASARVSVPGQAAVPPQRGSEPAAPAAASVAPVSGSAQVRQPSAPPSGPPAPPAQPSVLQAPQSAPPANRPMAAWQEQLAQPAGLQQRGAASVPPLSSPPAGGAFGSGPSASDSPMAMPRSEDETAPSGTKSRLRMIGYISIAVLVVVLGVLALSYTASPTPPSYKVGSCVQESGGKAEQVSCSTSGAFQIVSKVSDHTQCPDPAQPYATVSGNSVLCLKPKS